VYKVHTCNSISILSFMAFSLKCFCIPWSFEATCFCRSNYVMPWRSKEALLCISN